MFQKPPTFEWIIPIKGTFLFLIKVVEWEMKICLLAPSPLFFIQSLWIAKVAWMLQYFLDI